VILQRDTLDLAELEARTGWAIKPEGACRGDVCVPITGERTPAAIAERLRMPLLRDEAHGLWCLGPEHGGRALHSAVAPDFELPDRHGNSFRLSSLRGMKIFLLAWASW
jgi:hypothetical protein